MKEKKQWVNKFNTVEKVQEFIDSNCPEITPTEFYDKYPGLHRIISKNHWVKFLVFKNRLSTSHSDFKTIEDFNKFIKDNNILSPTDFRDRFTGLYSRLLKMGFSSKADYLNRGSRDRINYLKLKKETEEEFQNTESIQKYIDDNKIINSKNLKEVNISLYRFVVRCRLGNKLIYYNEKSPEYILKFIEDNNIITKREFKARFPKYYHRICNSTAFTRPPISRLFIDKSEKYINSLYDRFKNKELLQRLIDYKKFKNLNDLKKTYKKLGKLIEELEYDDLIYYPIKYSWDNINSLDDVQEFIQENQIASSPDLVTRFSGLYDKISNNRWTHKVKYFGSNIERFDSDWEKRLFTSLAKKSFIKNINHNFSFNSCVDKKPLPFDIVAELSNGKKLVIEVQGPVHYKPVFSNTEFVKVRKHDILKNRWSKENNYFIYYLTLDDNLLKKYKYPYFVYNRLEELISDIEILGKSL